MSWTDAALAGVPLRVIALDEPKRPVAEVRMILEKVLGGRAVEMAGTLEGAPARRGRGAGQRPAGRSRPAG